MKSIRNNFSDFSELRDSLEGLNFSGFNLRNASSSGLIELVYKRYRTLSAVKKIAQTLFTKNQAHTNFANHLKKNSLKNIFTYGTTRNAHYELINSYIESFKVKKTSIIINVMTQRVGACNNIGIFFCCAWRYFFKNPLRLKFFKRVVVFSALYEAVCEIMEIEKVFAGINLPDTYLPFNSAWGSENLYTQFFKKNACLTLSLQHAIYYEFIDTIPLDVINYINVESDYLLVWGAYSEDQIGKYLPDNVNILKVGNPLFSKNLDAHNVSKLIQGLSQYLFRCPGFYIRVKWLLCSIFLVLPKS